jgi:hypothetical protein
MKSLEISDSVIVTCSYALYTWSINRIADSIFRLYSLQLVTAYSFNIIDFMRARIATGYGMDDQGVVVRVPIASRIFSSQRLPDRFWGLPGLLSNRYGGLFPWG